MQIPTGLAGIAYTQPPDEIRAAMKLVACVCRFVVRVVVVVVVIVTGRCRRRRTVGIPAQRPFAHCYTVMMAWCECVCVCVMG